MRSPTGLTTWIVAAAAVFIGAAGVLKLLDLPGFLYALKSWTILPRPMAAIFVLVVPTAEAVLSGLWLTGVSRFRCDRAMLFLVGAFSGLYLAQWIIWKAPDCGCLGTVSRYFRQVETGLWAMGRNIVIMAALLLGVRRPEGRG